LQSFRPKRCEVYANFAKLSSRTSVKFVVAKVSSQTLRGPRQLCEALNSNAKCHVYLVTRSVRDALKKSSSFRTLRRLHELAKLSTLTTLHGVQFIHGFTATLIMHQARLMLPLHIQSFSGVNRVWPFLGKSEVLCCKHFQLRVIFPIRNSNSN